MQEFLYITFGWLLGLLGNPVITKIENHYKRKNIKVGIFSELEILCVRLAASCYRIQMHLGTRNKESIIWIKTIYRKYRTGCPEDVIEALDKMLKVPDEQFNAFVEQTKAETDVGLKLKTFSMPFTESVMGQLGIFKSEFQRKIFEVVAQVNILNEDIETATFYHRLTFDASSATNNMNIIKGNLTVSYNDIVDRCKIIVNKIEEAMNR